MKLCRRYTLYDPHQTHQYLGCSSINIIITIHLTTAPEFEPRENENKIVEVRTSDVSREGLAAAGLEGLKRNAVELTGL